MEAAICIDEGLGRSSDCFCVYANEPFALQMQNHFPGRLFRGQICGVDYYFRILELLVGIRDTYELLDPHLNLKAW